MTDLVRTPPVKSAPADQLFGWQSTSSDPTSLYGAKAVSVWCYIISDLHCAAGVSGLYVLASKADMRRLDRSRLCAAACRGLSFFPHLSSS
jgi:hypothetical protein